MRLSLVCLLLFFGSIAASSAQDASAYTGRSVQSVIDELRAGGLAVVYSTNLVPETLRIGAEPRSTDPVALAREILAPHGLTLQPNNGAWLVVRAPVSAVRAAGGLRVTVIAARDGMPVGAGSVELDNAGQRLPLAGGEAALEDVAAGRHTLIVRAPGYLPERLPVEVLGGRSAEVRVALFDAVPPLDELTVTASRYDVASESAGSTTYFTGEDIEGLALLGADSLRAVQRVPGVAAGEFSARAYVRGGAADEMDVMLDGMELVEPYHFRDYQSVFSVVDQRIVSGMQVYSGGFPAQYGDALSGLTVIDLVEPMELHHEVGLSLLYTSALTSGTFGKGGRWLASARRGNLDRLLNDELGEPSFRDGFVHMSLPLGVKHRLTLNDIGYDDNIELSPKNSVTRRERGVTNTDSNQWWLVLDSEWTAGLSSRTLAHSTRFATMREGTVDVAGQMRGAAVDYRTVRAHGFKQDWRWEPSDRQLLTFGGSLETQSARYVYSSTVALDGPLAALVPSPRPDRASALAPEGETYSAYVSDRVRLADRWVVDLGLRWDRQTRLPPADDDQLSARSSLLFRLGGRTDLRFSVGRFFQSEELLGLQIEDGVSAFAPAQSASHSIVGLEHRFPSGIALRAEVFRKWTRSARPRYENLFDPLALLPELRPGRVLISPDRAEARGFELLLSGMEPFDWWVSYALGEADDVIGADRVPRSWDQRHSVNAGLGWSTGEWSLNAVASWHTGWPMTLLIAMPGAGSPLDIVAGERNAERLPPVRRLDFRASRDFAAGPGSMRFFAEITNLTGHQNPCCVSYEVAGDPAADDARLVRQIRSGVPFVANLGVTWSF